MSMSVFKTVLAGFVLLGIAGALPPPARADLISNIVYRLTVCGGYTLPQPGSPCHVEPAQILPPPGSLDGLSEELFDDFFAAHGVQWYGDNWIYTVNGANSAGYVYGHVIDSVASADTQFVFYQGELLCCTEDFPFAIFGLNDNGIFIGRTGGSFPFASSEFDSFAVSPKLPILDAASIAFLEAALPLDPYWVDFLLGSTFAAIDNNNRISGIGPYLGAFVLTPIPEPGSFPLCATALLLLLFLYGGERRRGSWPVVGRIFPPCRLASIRRRAAASACSSNST